MKKMYLFFLAFVITNFVNAQFTSLWQVNANTQTTSGVAVNTGPYTWFQGNGTMIPPASSYPQANNTTSLAYSQVEDKLFVANRNDRIAVINPATGAEEGTLSLSGLGTEAFKFNKIRVDADGVIYGLSLSTAISNPVKIYRWANRSATPTKCAEFAVTERCGDAFGISGTGANTIFYTSGSAMAASPAPANSINIYVLNTTNGLDFTVNKTINLPTVASGQWANRTIEPISNDLNSDLWIKGGGFNARRITVNGTSASVALSIPDGTGVGQASLGYGGMKLLNLNNKKLLSFAGGNNSTAGTKFRVLDVTDELAITNFGEDSLGTLTFYTANTNGTGDLSFKVNNDNTFTAFYLSTNNGIEATQSPSLLPVSLSSFAGSIKDGIASLTWKTDNEINNKGFEIEKSFNGSDFSTIGFVAAGENASNTYSFSESKNLAANNYYRLKQVDKDGKYTRSSVILLQNKTNIQQLVLFGNVVKSQLNAQIEATKTGASSIAIVDMSGKVVKTIQKQLQKGTNQVSFSVIGLQAGNYQLQIATTEGRTSARFVVAK